MNNVLPRLAHSPREVAAALGVSEKTVIRLIEAKKLTAMRAGRLYLIPKTSLEKFLESSTNQ